MRGAHVPCGWLRPPLRSGAFAASSYCVAPRVPLRIRLAQRLGQRRDVDGEPMAFQRPEGERKAGQHRPRLQQLQHGVAPVIEQRQRAGVPHQRPQPVEPVCGIAGRSASALALALSGFTQRRSNSHTLVSEPNSVRR
jgi:hypothetical protein